MKLELDMWRHLLDVYTKFQTDIAKHVQKSVPNLSPLYDFKAMNVDKLLWPIFGCKVCQSVPIGMELKLDV